MTRMRDERERFKAEADMVDVFCQCIRKRNENQRQGSPWKIYPETADFDILLVQEGTGVQIGIEAKLQLNPLVLNQVLPGRDREEFCGPDYRAVLVPTRATTPQGLGNLARRCGVQVMTVYNQLYDLSGRSPPIWSFRPDLPDEESQWSLGYDRWQSWLPAERCPLPEYIPDVRAGCPSPVKLTAWKIKAIKLMILLERRGFVTRKDMKALELSPTRFTDPYNGILASDRAAGGYVRHAGTPDMRRQHPLNYAQIERDFDKWGTGL